MSARRSTDPPSWPTPFAFSALTVIACAMPVHNDTWWHLRAGQATWHGLSPFVDHFSWTVRGEFFWNHSWLSQVAFYAVHVVGGLPLLTALCAAAVVATWWLVWRQCRGEAVERLLLLGVALPVSTLTWSVRPQVAIVFLPIVVSLVASGRTVPLAFVMALWANLHAGFAVAGAVFAAGLGAALVFDRTLVVRRTAAALVGIIATLATPLGVTNWREVAASVGRSQANAIVEWQPPGLGGHNLFFWGTGIAFAVLLALRWRRLDAPYLQVSALAACLAFVSATQAMRNIPAFMLLALPPLSALLFDAACPTPRTRPASRWSWGPAIPVAFVAGWLWTHPSSAMGWQPIGDRARATVAACHAPMFNTYELGGPLIWFVPSQPVFVDSRQDPYPVSLVQEAVQVEQLGRYHETFERHGINCAVLPPRSPAVLALANGGWRPIYQDNDWSVFERLGAQSGSGVK